MAGLAGGRKARIRNCRGGAAFPERITFLRIGICFSKAAVFCLCPGALADSLNRFSFGERHLSIRQGLVQLVHEVRDLAERNNSTKNLRDEGLFDFLTPITFATVGPLNAGKSLFLNALFGQEICQVDRLPCTKEIRGYQYAKERKVTSRDGIEEHRVPVPGLNPFRLVDTPGLERLSDEEKATVLEVCETADVVFMVIPFKNPWSAPAWDFLEKLSSETLNRTMLILNQAEEKTDADIEVTRDHVLRLCQQRLGRDVRLYPVSSASTYEARRTDQLTHKAHVGGGFLNVETAIDEAINYSPSRRRTLREVCQLIEGDLRIVEKRMDELTHVLATEKAYLEQLENDRENLRNEEVKNFTNALPGLMKAFQVACGVGLTRLNRHLSFTSGLLTIVRHDRIATETEHDLTFIVQKEVERWANEEADRLEAVCRDHWSQMVPQIEDRLKVEAPSLDEELDGFRSTRKTFVESLRSEASQTVYGLKLRSLLDSEMEIRREGFRRYMGVMLGLLTGMGIAGATGMYPLVWIFLTLFGLFGIGLGLFHLKSRTELHRIFKECLRDCQQPFLEQMRGRCQHAALGVFKDYSTLLGTVRRHIAESEADLDPQAQEWNNLFLTMRSIEQSL